jgi:8-oxo-dGTP diphosphatase
MSERAAAIILLNNSLLLIHRYKSRREYYVFPGGHIEYGESVEQACVREVKEETGLESVTIKHVFDFNNGNRLEHYFFVQVVPGPLVLGGPESAYQSKENIFLPEWIPLSGLQNPNILPGQALTLLQTRLDSTDR